ncbi:hypothetical protein [Okeania sp. SIO2B3]|uniref:hypothetical protein n=1 Tax=Okeania sp. SIO2B3 TaxID=2607784 RepID=UPI0013BED321|nr:hypothetical protein [Okeania sp. SIO2B3]NET43437.1 hypothetical protein [Okeania sp. SIO2B3]
MKINKFDSPHPPLARVLSTTYSPHHLPPSTTPKKSLKMNLGTKGISDRYYE